MIFMKKIIFILSFVLIMTNANAQSEIKAYGSKAMKGQAIHGVVRDSEGAVKAADVFEVNSKKEVVTYTFTDKNGHFSFELVNPEDSILVGGIDYFTARSPLSNNQYDIMLMRCPGEGLNTEMNSLFNRTYRSLIAGSSQYPYLYMDNHIIYRDSKAWEGIDPNKDSYSKQEISHLFGVEAGQIEKIEVYVKGSEEAKIQVGPGRAERGAILIQTKTKKGK